MLKYLTSTIIIKIVMALTGLGCLAFLVVHAIGNLQYWIGPDTYNTYAYFLQSLGEILWLVRIGLAVCLILHVISAVYLKVHNIAAKPTGYQVKNYMKAKMTTRVMLWTGILICCFLLFHLLHFTAGVYDFEGGYNQDELHPTGTFVVCGGDACTTQGGDCCKMDKGACSDCKLGGNACATTQSGTEGASCCATDQPTTTIGASCEVPAMASNVADSVSACCATDAQVNSHKSCQSAGDKCCKKDNKGKCSAATQGCSTSQCSSFGNTTINIYDEAIPGEVIKPRHDVYGMVSNEFSNPWVVLVYVIFVCILGFHLNHAIQSAFQTLGIEGPKFTPCMRILSTLLSIGIVLLFIILPLGILAKTLCGCCFGGM